MQIPERVVYHAVGDEMVLFDPELGVFCRLNSVGSRFWELLAASDRLQCVFNICANEYEVSPDELQQELLRLVGRLHAQGMIEVV